MVLRTLFTMLALCAVWSSLGDDMGAYVLDEALAADDACAGDDATCAMNALQISAQEQQVQQQHQQQQDAQQPKEDAVVAEPVAAQDMGGGVLHDQFVLKKRYNLSAAPEAEFEIEEHSDEFLTHSCSDYTNDGSTVFSRDGNLVLKVASAGKGGKSLNSGRIMSKESYRYGLFTFSAKVPKCNYVWPAIWLLPGNKDGQGPYGTWPCSGEIDVLETVHDQSFGTFNVVAGYGTSSDGCYPQAQMSCNTCKPTYCTSTTMNSQSQADRYFVQPTNCEAGDTSWEEHTFVLNWQPDELTTWIDPVMSWDAQGNLVKVEPKAEPAAANGMQTWKTYKRQSTPTWLAVGDYHQQCFPAEAGADAPFDIGFKIVLNIAVGGYGGAPCVWGADSCSTTCGGAIGSELVMSDISVWERRA